MDVKKAARNTLDIWFKRVRERGTENSALPTPRQNPDGMYLSHQHWMLKQVEEGTVEGDKAQRWLGYAQGYLVADQSISLMDAKYANIFA